jgi:proton-translocating NADH-quinone oxidoreductase chain L
MKTFDFILHPSSLNAMPTPALLLLIATLLPLASFTLLVFVGKRMGYPLAGIVGTLAIFGGFICTTAATFAWFTGGSHEGKAWGFGVAPINITAPWLPIGHAGAPGGINQDHPGYLDLGVYVDSVTMVMFAMITGVATLIHIFSIGYMREDPRFPRFFTYLGLFCFSMLGLVLGGTLIQLFVFWELVGLCSYLLIGFWYEKKSASNAAIKAFVTNRVGDFGFLIGLGILIYHVGNASLPNLWILLSSAGQGGDVMYQGGVLITATTMTIIGIGLFCGAVGKSAQFPLHVWLPDAMEGPTPVSALIHAATMVAAGVYLVARIFPILSPDAKLVIATIGCITLTMAALIAVAQTDIKKVLAYSTLSQLGYMMLALGIGSWVGGLFHLITHAFFKALLFLGSGSVIHAMHHHQELSDYGGLWKKIPATAITFGIGVLAIAGTPFLSGYYSKDMILAHAAAFGHWNTHGEHGSPMFWIFFILPAVIAYVTAFYMTRCWMLTFWGKPRNHHLYDHAHESPILWLPLVALAVASIFGGSMFKVQETIEAAQKEQQVAYTEDAYKTAWPTMAQLKALTASHEEAAGHESEVEKTIEEGEQTMHKSIGFAWLIGIGAGFLLYLRGYAITDKLMKITPLRWMQTWLIRRMYIDDLYDWVFVMGTRGLAIVCGAFDKYIIDGLVNGVAKTVKNLSFGVGWYDQNVIDSAVNGAADFAHGLGEVVRTPQTGRVRVYVMVLMTAVTLGLAGAVFAVLM